jgi:rod shape-determining protein MreC
MLDKKKNRLIKYYLIAVIILLVFLHYTNILSGFEDSIFKKITNVQGNAYSFITKLKFSFINYQEATELKKENIQLQHQYNQLLYDNSRLISYKYENEHLREILRFTAENNYTYLLSNIIGRDLNRANTLIIDKGRNEGLKNGDPVIIDNGILVGKVIDAKNDIAIILLLTDTLSNIAVSTLDSNKTIGVAKGEFGLSIKVELIPQDTAIKEGDVIVTSGLEQSIPTGLILGEVNRIISNENDLFKSVTINPLLDYEELTVLNVIITND